MEKEKDIQMPKGEFIRIFITFPTIVKFFVISVHWVSSLCIILLFSPFFFFTIFIVVTVTTVSLNINVWTFSPTVLEVDFEMTLFLFFNRLGLKSHHWYTSTDLPFSKIHFWSVLTVYCNSGWKFFSDENSCKKIILLNICTYITVHFGWGG
jgi:hypothetical protein